MNQFFRNVNSVAGVPHCGPFNAVSGKKGVGFDEACRQHDIAYGKMQSAGRNPYVTYNKADRDLLDQALDYNPTNVKEGVAMLVALGWFGAKKLLAKMYVDAPKISKN